MYDGWKLGLASDENLFPDLYKRGGMLPQCPRRMGARGPINVRLLFHFPAI